MYEKTLCGLCQSDNFKIIYKKTNSGQIVQCQTCGLIYANPRRTEFLIKDQIKTDEEIIGEEYLFEAKNKIKNFLKRFKYLQKVNLNGGLLLDIGAYTGLAMLAAQKIGYEVEGIEPNQIAAYFAQEEYHLNVQNVLLEQAQLSPHHYDVVTMFQVIEHLPDPNKTLQEIHQVLKNNGLVVIETPNINSLIAKITRIRWRQFIPSHFWFFDKNSLSKILRENNFEPIVIKYPGKKISLELIALTIERLYSKKTGQFLHKMFRAMHMENISIPVNFYDNILIIAKKK